MNVWRVGATGMGMRFAAREAGLPFNYAGYFPTSGSGKLVAFFTAVPGHTLNFYRFDFKGPGYRFPQGYSGFVPDGDV